MRYGSGFGARLSTDMGNDCGCGAEVRDLRVHVLAGSNSPKLGNVWIETESDANRGESGTRDWAASTDSQEVEELTRG
jgi:hypothetical protein